MPCESEGAVPPQKLEAGTCAAGEASTGAARKGLESLRLGAEEPTFSFVYELSEARTASLSIEAAAAAALVAEGEAQWLVAHWFGSQQRKHGVRFGLEGPSRVRVEGPPTSPEQSAAEYEAHWSKQIAAAVKKVDVENLGPMNAAELWEAIPEEDSAGRGRPLPGSALGVCRAPQAVTDPPDREKTATSRARDYCAKIWVAFSMLSDDWRRQICATEAGCQRSGATRLPSGRTRAAGLLLRARASWQRARPPSAF